jgi:hypothetical protein
MCILLNYFPKHGTFVQMDSNFFYPPPVHPHERQDQRFLWFEIYSTYISIIKRTHYFPEHNATSYSNSFRTAFKHRIQTAYRSYFHKKNMILASRDKSSKSKVKLLTKQFLKTWHHPSICSLNDDDTISIHVFDNVAQDKYQELQTKSHNNMILRWSIQDA